MIKLRASRPDSGRPACGAREGARQAILQRAPDEGMYEVAGRGELEIQKKIVANL